jgi:hypothetical protein
VLAENRFVYTKKLGLQMGITLGDEYDIFNEETGLERSEMDDGIYCY